MRTYFHWPLRAFLLVLLALVSVTGPQASPDPNQAADLSSYGIFYDRYEPSFYTGFAPRVEEPGRLHLHVGRGNQLRMTLVVSDAVLAAYAGNLLTRYWTYRRLIDQGKVQPTQNGGFKAFEQAIRELGLDEQVARESDLAPENVRERNLRLMEKLNPGRVFRIKISIDALIQLWAAEVTAADRNSMPKRRQLDLINRLLPTRLWQAQLQPADSKVLKELVGLVPEEGGASFDALRQPYLALLARVSNGIYPVVGEHLAFTEFTAIHPVGTFNSYVNHKGRTIPQYPTPGRRALTYHQRSKTVDHIPTVAVYSYLPWIPYMHVGDRLHNSFHSLWWRMEPSTAGIVPQAIKSNNRAIRADGKPYQRLWLLSRGPMSHGCTHINAGHISELREMLPATPERMRDVDTFINKSHLFDVFDIDGDLKPEVMGVRYFIAYSLKNKRPHKLRAPIERAAFYDWLYGGELQYHTGGGGWLEDIRDGHFIARKAVDGRRYASIELYEAGYEPEKIQFYKMVDIPFARQLRQVGAEHPLAPGG